MGDLQYITHRKVFVLFCIEATVGSKVKLKDLW